MSITMKIGCILTTRRPKIFAFGLGFAFGFIVVFSVHVAFNYPTKFKLNPMLNTNKPLEVISSSVANKEAQEIVNSSENRDSFPLHNGEVAGVKVSTMKMEDKHCNIFFGRNKRPDEEYQHWRWQPNDCNIPRLNATHMLEMLRDKRLAFVGDSLNRNMWESLVCILRHAVQDKNRVYEISGRQDFKKEGFYAFRFEDYNCSVEFVRAPFLVQESERDGVNGSISTLRLDVMDSFAAKYKEAHVLVFNTGHWWTHDKTSQGKNYYQKGDYVYPQLNVLKAFRKALKTWGHWVDNNIDPNKTKVFFRGYSASHFRGGQWNSGGQCHKETQPIFNETYLIKYPAMMNVLESVIQGEMKTPITYLNITRITDYRKDAHPSIYTQQNQDLSQEERLAQHKIQDCSHWCLPGVPDTWNELLYAFLTSLPHG
ncbi:hypothetical protein SUGI_0228260 [Cryptomeria japonica]|nr:hypothetical protein SUGI_0228260 [Cryptomeria japonica]